MSGTGRENLLWVDDALGALFAKLEAGGKIDNTIIFFFNDHGQNSKGTLYQGGIKSQAFVWRSEGFKCGRDCDAPVANIDFLQTILELAGRKNTDDLVDGYSFASMLEGVDYTARDSMYFELGFTRAVVKDGFKHLAGHSDYQPKLQEMRAELRKYTVMLPGRFD